MQFQSKVNAFKRLKLVLGNEAVQRFAETKILLVGVGGIGCQVIKNLSKFPINKLVIIDLDVIELSNLNRQFYFRKQHIRQSKSKIARQQILKLVPDLNIGAIEGSIYDKKYDNYHFYSQFDLVISALDNMKARQHLARNCTRYGKVLIDAGTAGFNGQSYPSIRFITSCHNCYPSVQEENFAVCTIRSKPQKSIHCAVYAKNLYQQFFGANESDDFLTPTVQQIKSKVVSLKEKFSVQKAKEFGIDLFNYLFCGQFKNQNEQVNAFVWQNAIQGTQENQMFTLFEKLSQTEDRHLSLSEYSQLFMASFLRLVERKSSLQNIPQSFDKDDQDCSFFLFSITNLRIFNFKSSFQASSKLKHLTHQQCRKMIGKLIPAIASTNSIAASIQTNQVKNFISNLRIQPKYMTISPFNEEKVSFSWISLPNPQCQVCSPRNLYFQVVCNLSERTFEELENFAQKNCFSFGRDLYCENLILIKNINAQKISANKKKLLNFKPDLMIQSTLTVRFLPTSKISDLKVEIILIDKGAHKQDQQIKFKILNEKNIQQTLQAIQSQHKKKQFQLVEVIQIQSSEQYFYNGWEEVQID